MILCIYKVHASVFFKGIYTSGNSRTAGLVRPNIQKKIMQIIAYMRMIVQGTMHRNIAVHEYEYDFYVK